MTAKALEERYPDAEGALYDLEDALAIEAARSGRATGEATAVLRSLPGDTRRRVPLRMRWRKPVLGVALGILVASVILVLVLGEAARKVEKGTGASRAKPPAGAKEVSVHRGAAHDYDPLSGDKQEHRSEITRVLDRDPATSWSTESYRDNQLGKAGVGLYIDAAPKLAASALLVQTSQQGWKATIYGANAPVPANVDGWTRVGGGTVEKGKQRFALDTRGRAYRYYLVWITALPPDSPRVQIGDIVLYTRR
jgi:serine/threonine-protein kinase